MDEWAVAAGGRPCRNRRTGRARSGGGIPTSQCTKGTRVAAVLSSFVKSALNARDALPQAGQFVIDSKAGLPDEEYVRQYRCMKVLFLSGYSSDAIHDAYVLHPGLPFLQKPFGSS